MSSLPTTPNAAWYLDGILWVRSLVSMSADYFSRPLEPHDPHPKYRPVEDHLYDIRHRMQNF